MRQFIATKAFIVHNGKVLLLRESHNYSDGTNAGRFDVVGGRISPGERFDDSLLREIREETGLSVKIGRPFFVSEWRPVVKGEPWQVVGVFFECFSDSDIVKLSGDHSEYLWINPVEFKNHNIVDNLHSVFDAFLKKSV